MLALEIELLTGRYVATSFDNRYEAEWPPHPARVFSAFVAVLHEDAVTGIPDPTERAALEWLQGRGAPHIYASKAHPRDVLDVYVPINDKTVLRGLQSIFTDLRDADTDKKRANLQTKLKKLIQEANAKPKITTESIGRAKDVLPASRTRNARTFPSVTLDDPIVQLIWPDADPSQAVRCALDSLAARVTRLGHSSSLVRLAWVDAHRQPTCIPDEAGDLILRCTRDGQLVQLEAAFERHRGLFPRVLPRADQRYRHEDDMSAQVREPLTGTVFGTDWVVFRILDRDRLPIVRAGDLAAALRSTVIAQAGVNAAEVLTGRAPDGLPSSRPHVAYVSLPYVGFPHADGSLLGVAAILPKVLQGVDRRDVLRVLGQVERLQVSPNLQCSVERISWLKPPPRTLDIEKTWCGKASVWGTVTPILLDRFPGKLGARDPEVAERAECEAIRSIRRGCEHVGLPAPREVALVTLPPFRGTEVAERFRRRRRPGQQPRVRVHALIDFGTLVRGPVLLGAGRYVGLGLCRPYWSNDGDGRPA